MKTKEEKMKRSMLLLTTLAILTAAGCAPGPRGGDSQQGRPKPPTADELFSKADVNGDGVLTKEELAAALPAPR
jgi:hypothetical protein